MRSFYAAVHRASLFARGQESPMVTNRSSLAAIGVSALVMAAPSVVRAQCTAPPVSVVPMSAVVAQGGYLSSDGKGAYVDGTQGSIVNLNGGGNGGANLSTSVDVPLNRNS